MRAEKARAIAARGSAAGGTIGRWIAAAASRPEDMAEVRPRMDGSFERAVIKVRFNGRWGEGTGGDGEAEERSCLNRGQLMKERVLRKVNLNGNSIEFLLYCKIN